MATEYIDEKIETLKNLIRQEELARFQNQLIVDDAALNTPDQLSNETLLQAARNAAGAVVIHERRLKVRRAELATLTGEREQAKIDAAAAANKQ